MQTTRQTKTSEQTQNQHDNSKKTGENQGVVADLRDRPKMSYDMGEINRFFDTVFHTPLADDEHILSWTAKTNRPSFPVDLDKSLDRLDRTGLARACYFGTSTVTPDPADGELYNRKSQFKRLHVVVLDDIGTKVNPSDLPEDLVPNYVIETSAGNFQYGFILETPIDDYDLAEALIHLVYTSGYSDTGGKMPTKVVRMPCGVNGKEGEKGDFIVRLVELNDEYWTPDELLEVLDVGVSWSDVVADVSVAKQGKSARFAGTSLWSPIRPTAASLNGVIDPVLEWLYENDMVVSDHGNWVNIRCPWADGHTHVKGPHDLTAGYSPIGRGGENSNRRAFHCFHDHCSEHDTREFLKEIATRSGIHAPIIDNVADIVADYAFVGADNSAYRIRGVNKPVSLKMDAFKNMHNRKVVVYDHKGNEKLVAESALWLSSPNRLTLQGTICDPSKPERIVTHDGLRYLNTYAAPQWGKGTYDVEDVAMFKRFMEYLIPRAEQRDYFMQWLAAKAQHPTFKGAAILMVAPTQGTGRTTLTDMIATLFTSENVRKVTFPQLCNATEANAFNDFLEAGIVTCDEVMSNTHNKHKVYEALKDLFDPRPKEMMINTKYGSQRPCTVYTSYLLLTNHTDAIGNLGGDRRVYVIENTIKPQTPEFFEGLNKWLAVKDGTGTAKWARSVWRWLQTLTPDLAMLHEPAPDTEIKNRMIDETASIVDQIYEAMLEAFGDIIPTGPIKQLAQAALDKMLEPDSDTKSEVVVRLLKTRSVPTELRVRLLGKQSRVRISNSLLRSLPADEVNNLTPEALYGIAHARQDALIALFDKGEDAVVNRIIAALEEIIG